MDIDYTFKRVSTVDVYTLRFAIYAIQTFVMRLFSRISSTLAHVISTNMSLQTVGVEIACNPQAPIGHHLTIT